MKRFTSIISLLVALVLSIGLMEHAPPSGNPDHVAVVTPVTHFDSLNYDNVKMQVPGAYVVDIDHPLNAAVTGASLDLSGAVSRFQFLVRSEDKRVDHFDIFNSDSSAYSDRWRSSTIPDVVPHLRT